MGAQTPVHGAASPKPATVERLKKRGGGYGCNFRPVRKVQNFGSALLHFYMCHRFNIVSAAEGSAMMRATAMRCSARWACRALRERQVRPYPDLPHNCGNHHCTMPGSRCEGWLAARKAELLPNGSQAIKPGPRPHVRWQSQPADLLPTGSRRRQKLACF
jgi:hypothetical protein